MQHYKKVRKEISNARQEHLTKANQTLIQKVDNKEREFERQMRLNNNRGHQQQVRKRIIGFLSKLEEKKKWNKPKRYQTIDDMWSEVSMTRSITSERQLYNKNEKNAAKGTNGSFLKAFVRVPNSPKAFNLKVSQHTYHPPSKLLLQSDPHQKDFMGLGTHFTDQKMGKHETSNNLKLGLHENPALKNKENFKKYYSGGPEDQHQLIFQVDF